MIVANFETFRSVFAERAEEQVVSSTFIAGPPSRINGPGASGGFLAGHTVQVVGSASNDGYHSTISLVDGSGLEFTTNVVLVAEGPISVTVSGEFRDTDGRALWPIANVRAGGFDTGVSGIPNPYDPRVAPYTLTVNAGAADGSPGSDEYHWYLSQRTDSPASQYLSAIAFTDATSNTYSGSVVLNHTTLAETIFGFTTSDALTPGQLTQLFKYVHLYVQRVSDDAIQWVDLLRVMNANTAV